MKFNTTYLHTNTCFSCPQEFDLLFWILTLGVSAQWPHWNTVNMGHAVAHLIEWGPHVMRLFLLQQPGPFAACCPATFSTLFQSHYSCRNPIKAKRAINYYCHYYFDSISVLRQLNKITGKHILSWVYKATWSWTDGEASTCRWWEWIWSQLVFLFVMKNHQHVLWTHKNTVLHEPTH